MDVEERTKEAIILTREILLSVLDDPGSLIAMIVNDVAPEDVEDQVCNVLEYLGKTTPEAEGR